MLKMCTLALCYYCFVSTKCSPMSNDKPEHKHKLSTCSCTQKKIKSVKVAHLHVTVKCRQCLYTFSTKLCVWSAVLNCSFFSLGQLPTDFIARQHTDARYWYSKSVCPSVRLSVCYVPVSDENGLTYRHSFFHLYGSPIIPVLPASNIFTKFRRDHPLQGR